MAASFRYSAAFYPSIGPALMTSHARGARRNRLAGESSPYLLQHADNPVDWYPWDREALDRAMTLTPMEAPVP